MSIYYDIPERKAIEAAVKECLRRSWQQEGSLRFAVRRRDDDTLAQYTRHCLELISQAEAETDAVETIFSCEGESCRSNCTMDEYVDAEYASWRKWKDEEERFAASLIAETMRSARERRRLAVAQRYLRAALRKTS
jgi:hypothetical protein